MAIGILATGAYVPETVVDNDQISAWADIPKDWIEGRTGILERRYADPHTPTSALALGAARDLENRHPDALGEVSAIIVATSTPDHPQPPTSLLLQGRLRLRGVPAFDINAVCSGFVAGLIVGTALAEYGALGNRLLLVGADKYSAIMDGKDHRTVSLFGDGGGAAILGPVPDSYGLRASRMVGDGDLCDLVFVKGGGTRLPLDGLGLRDGMDRFRMKGPEVREYALERLPPLIREAVEDAGLALNDIERFILHQANPVLLKALARKLGIPYDRIPITATHYGNTAAASVPITLAESHATHPIKRGDHIVIAAVGGGMSAVATVVTWY